MIDIMIAIDLNHTAKTKPTHTFIDKFALENKYYAENMI